VKTAITFQKVTAGEAFTCGLPPFQAGGTDAYCWGTNEFGQLGTGGSRTVNQLLPVKVAAGTVKWSYLTAGLRFICGTAANTVPSQVAYCWGDNGIGQAGSGTAGHYLTPQRVALDYRFFAIAAGSEHTCGQRDNGWIYCWGYGGNGALGNGSFFNRAAPYPVSGNFSYQNKLAAGAHHTLAVRSDGAVVSWGSNTFGQLGNGTTNSSNLPIVTLPASQ
jgi:alpha-tubulin suppressor-like RCC1 family protein